MKKEKSILNYDGLYGDDAGKNSPDYLFLERIETRSAIFNWDIPMHLHLYLYQVFIVEKGNVIFANSSKKHTIQAPAVLIIPATHLHGLSYSPDITGRILTVSSQIIENLFTSATAINNTFLEINLLQAIEVSIFENINAILNKIDEELFSNHSERWLMLQSLLSQLLISLHRQCHHATNQKVNHTFLHYFRKFKASIDKSDFTKQIPEYATELGISAVHLNRICRAVSSKTAVENIQMHFVAEAENYLRHSPYSVSEIAYLLKFEYPNYFARIFKKHTGLSPSDYRKNID